MGAANPAQVEVNTPATRSELSGSPGQAAEMPGVLWESLTAKFQDEEISHFRLYF